MVKVNKNSMDDSSDDENLISDSDSVSDSDSDSDEVEDNDTMQQPLITTKSISSIYNEYLKNNDLQLTPEYQRELCWSVEKMNTFVDTIMKNWIVPNYVIYELPDSEIEQCDHSFECVDGQHRLTSLKWFIEGIKDERTGRYVHWKKDGHRVFYNMSDDELVKLPKSWKARNFTKLEKKNFDGYNMCIQILKCKSNKSKGISFATKCSIFNRLQNGEKISSYDKIKNLHTNQISNCIRSSKLVELFVKKHKIHEKLQTRKMKKYESFAYYFLVRVFLILDRKSLETNYLDLNIKRYLESNNGTGSSSVKIKNSLDSLIPKVNDVLKILAGLEILIIPELAYMFICVYAQYGIDEVNKLQKIFKKNEVVFAKFNTLKKYQPNGVTSTPKMTNLYDDLIKSVLKKDTGKESNKEIEV